eukprot:11172321-Prorocentrum_lima.AAC.1
MRGLQESVATCEKVVCASWWEKLVQRTSTETAIHSEMSGQAKHARRDPGEVNCPASSWNTS